MGKDIHDLIDEWHDGNDPRPLHEFLGMTWEEYARWLRCEGLPERLKGELRDEDDEDEETQKGS